MLLMIVEFIVGCGILAWGADRFIAGSTGIARHFGMSDLLIGVVLIGFGTTFPEIVVGAIAAFHQQPGLAIGNAVGSNITNIALILGVSVLVAPIAIHSSLVKREIPFLLIISLLASLLVWDGQLTRFDGLILLVLLVLYLWAIMYFVPRDKDMKQEITEIHDEKKMTMTVSLFWWFFGLALLFISSELIVMAATMFAHWLKVSDLVIGLTVVALGTSLPELAATIMSSVRGRHDVAIGNIIGSNVFNMLAVLATPALIAPSSISKDFLWRDLPFMLGLSLLLWFLSMCAPNKGKLGRPSGVIFLLCYFGYIGVVMFVKH